MFKFLLLATLVSIGESHIRMLVPAQRSSLWREAKYAAQKPQENSADDAIYCGGIPQPVVPDKCGVCGDPAADPVPRPNEEGGKYGKDIIAETYKEGQEIPIAVQVNVLHGGGFELQVCDKVPATEECFKKYPPLEITCAKDGKKATRVPLEGEEPRWINGTAKLPAGLKCKRCVLRLENRCGSEVGICEDKKEAKGCGKQLLFRNCADIVIE